MSEMDELPAYAGALIGFRRDGRPIYLAAGGAPEDDDTDVDEDASEREAEPADEDGDDEEIDWKAKYEAQKAINRRLEQRQKNQQASKAKPAKAAAKQQADDEPDERDQQVAAAEAKAADAQMQLHVSRLLTKNGYDADQLLDSNKFLDAVNGLDVDEDTSEDELNEMVLELAAKHGKKKTGSGRVGADVSGGAGRRDRATSLSAAIAARMSGGR